MWVCSGTLILVENIKEGENLGWNDARQFLRSFATSEDGAQLYF
jgi:hypothetical protein